MGFKTEKYQPSKQPPLKEPPQPKVPTDYHRDVKAHPSGHQVVIEKWKPSNEEPNPVFGNKERNVDAK